MMITEANALEIAQLDAKGLYDKLNEGAMPEDLARLTIRRILYHINSFDRPRAIEKAKLAAQRRMTAPTHSQLLASRCTNIIIEAMKELLPEDSRALALWFAGAPPQVPGFLRHAVLGLTESSAEEAVDEAEKHVLTLLDRMQRVDHDLFQNKINVLTNPRQRIIRGLLLDAQWAFQERDGENARVRVILARKIAHRWLRDHLKRQQSG